MCIFIASPSCRPHHVHWHRRTIVVVTPLSSSRHCGPLSLSRRRAVAVVCRAAACRLCRRWCVGIMLLCVTPGPKGLVDGGGGGCYWCPPIVVAVGVAQCRGCWWVAHSGVWRSASRAWAQRQGLWAQWTVDGRGCGMSSDCRRHPWCVHCHGAWCVRLGVMGVLRWFHVLSLEQV